MWEVGTNQNEFPVGIMRNMTTNVTAAMPSPNVHQLQLRMVVPVRCFVCARFRVSVVLNQKGIPRNGDYLFTYWMLINFHKF